MDTFMVQHLQAWAESTLHDEERESVIKGITAYVEHNPDVIKRDFSWLDIRNIIERNQVLALR